MFDLFNTITGLFTGSTWAWVAAGAVALLTALSTLLFKADKGGYNRRKAQELDAYEKHLEELRRAGAAKPTGSVSDDPHNRDNRKS